MSQWVQQNPIDMQRPRKTPHNRQQKQSTSSSCEVKWLGLGSITWLKYGFSFSSDCFLSTKLFKFSVKVCNLDNGKKPKNSLVQQCLEMKSYQVIHKRIQTGEDRKLEIINPSWIPLSNSLHGVARPYMQKKIIYSRYKLLERGYGKTAGSWGYWWLFFCILVHPK